MKWPFVFLFVGTVVIAASFFVVRSSLIQPSPSEQLPASINPSEEKPSLPNTSSSPEPPSSLSPVPSLSGVWSAETPNPYVEVIDSCGPYFGGDCVAAYSGPGRQYPVAKFLRTGLVLKVAQTITVEGEKWHRIAFHERIRYPERIYSYWYVADKDISLFYGEGFQAIKNDETPDTKKRIVIDVSEQKLYAYEGELLFMEEPVSTGKALTPTPFGTYSVYTKTPTRYMQGPLPGYADDYYDLPGVPWDLYFTKDGAVIHGAYWHNNFGQTQSHGCVNIAPQKAKELYLWADLGTTVTVQE